MTNREKYTRLSELLDEIEAYLRCLGKVQFDMECCAPEEGIAQAGEDMALVGKHVFALSHSPELQTLLCELHEDSEGLTALERKTVEYEYRDYCRTKNFTPEFAFENDKVHSAAYGAWLSAKQKNDFSLFRDSLAAVIDIERRAILLRDEQKETVYDSMLDDFEEGGSIAQLDSFFARLKERIVPLVRRIAAEGKTIRTDFLSRSCDTAHQEQMARYLLRVEGLRESALVLMTTEHPFTDHYGRSDVRVTTHYYEDAFLSSIYSTLHEGGHALFMQNTPEELYRHHVADRMTSAMHECISRFYENLIGRSEAFVKLVYPQLQSLAGGILDDVTAEEFYEGANLVHPGLIRTESDELTYCLHIIVRYELEKAFMNGEITVDEIPALWNAKYKEYLGVDVPDDAGGCLQDVHWTGGIAYFPSYALGNAYGVQILRVMQREFDVYSAVAAGELGKIRDWLTERVFASAPVSTPDEWIRSITGESLNPDYFLDYLEEKFTKLYALEDK